MSITAPAHVATPDATVNDASYEIRRVSIGGSHGIWVLAEVLEEFAPTLPYDRTHRVTVTATETAEQDSTSGIS